MNGPPLTPAIVCPTVREVRPAAPVGGIEPNVAEYMLTALARVRASAWPFAMRARAWMFAYNGIAMAARMPMIATTIISSMRVKPRWSAIPRRFLCQNFHIAAPLSVCKVSRRPHASPVLRVRITPYGELTVVASPLAPTVYVPSVAEVYPYAVHPVGEAGIDFMYGPPLTPLIVVATVRLAKAAGIEPNVAEYMLTALATVRASARALAIRARAWMFAYSGIAMAARMPMIATTIISSMSVKPRSFLVLCLVLQSW